MALFFRPRSWRSPGFRIRLDSVGSAIEKQLHEFQPAPPAGPAERSALEQIVAKIGTCPEVQQCRRKSGTVFRGDVFARAGDAMQDRQAEASAYIRITTPEDELKAG